MEEQIQQILSILLNSEEIPGLPVANSVPTGSKFIFYNPSTSRVETTTESGLGLVYKINSVSLGYTPTATETTSITETIAYINQIGFTIVAGQIKLVNLLEYKNGNLYQRKYYHRNNIPGSYGNNTNPLNVVAQADMKLLTNELVTEQEVDIVIDLGNIGTNTIENYINTNDDPSWNLEADKIYMFTCTINGEPKKYIYIGPLPNYIGQSNNNVSAADFFDLSVNLSGWHWIEGSNVEKGSNGGTPNTDLSTLQIGDIVWFKDVQDGSRTLTLRGWRYDGGDKSLITSYTKVKQIA